MPQPKPGAQFLNNIVLSLSSGTRDVDGTNLNGMVARNNYFSQGDPGRRLCAFREPLHGPDDRQDVGLACRDEPAIRSAGATSWWRQALPWSAAGDDEPMRTSTDAQDYQLDHNKAEHRQPMDMGGLTFATPINSGRWRRPHCRATYRREPIESRLLAPRGSGVTTQLRARTYPRPVTHAGVGAAARTSRRIHWPAETRPARPASGMRRAI